MTLPRPARIYLAGPEVFLPDPEALAQRKRLVCQRHGLIGVFPLDNGLDLTGMSPGEQARRISEANEALMRSCDALIANLTPFRGASMDSGTAFEVGFMRALGRPVLGYTNVAADYRDRAEAYRRATGFALADADGASIAIEDFGLAENLMIEIAIEASGGRVLRCEAPREATMTELTGFEACVRQAARLLGPGSP